MSTLPPHPDVEQDHPRCFHCGDWVTFQKDPSPDLCARCRLQGKRTPIWGDAENARYEEMIRRLEMGESFPRKG